MNVISNPVLLKSYLDRTGIDSFFNSKPNFQLLHYSPGELLTTAFSATEYLFFVIEGKLSLYDMPDEETIVFLETDFQDVTLIGEIELFDLQYESFFVEAVTDVYAIAIRLEENREMLLNDCKFLVYVCRSLEKKLSGAVSSSIPGTLKTRLERRIKRMPAGEHIRNISTIASGFGASKRQVLRVLKQLCNEGCLRREGRGDYVVNDRSGI